MLLKYNKDLHIMIKNVKGNAIFNIETLSVYSYNRGYNSYCTKQLNRKY